MGALLAPLSALVFVLWMAALGSYALVNGSASWWEARHAHGGIAFRLPLVFAVMHIAWGVGFWLELFALFWRRVRR